MPVVTNDASAVDCSLYASPSGSDANSGTTAKTPKTLIGAAKATQPGSVVCLLGGTYSLNSTFYPPNSGTPTSWIIYKNYGNGVVNIDWTGAADASPMFKMNGGGFPSNPSYLEFQGLHLDGKGKALDGFFCMGSHHLRFIGNSIRNTGGAGIAAVTCDYLYADHNLIDHNGYMPADAGKNAEYYSWTSGISFNSNQWFDRWGGFHNVISNNIIAGEVDESTNHTDGNGIILDLTNRTYKAESANTPPALVVNNVVYGNGGRCMEAYIVTNFWFVNNTCYKNNLDPFVGRGKVGSITVNNSRNGYVINNIAVVQGKAHPCYDEENTSVNVRYYRGICFGSSDFGSSPDRSEILYADPLFMHPPDFDPAARSEYSKALAPAALGNGLMLRSDSPALRKGIDPASLPGLPEAIVRDLKKHAHKDMNGTPRPVGKAFDLGAYQSGSSP
jgi:serralysin